MPMVDADWTYDRITGAARYIGDDHLAASPSYSTVDEFHKWLQAKLDDEVSVGDDELDITVSNASSRSTENIITLVGIANIDDNAAEHLYNGSIIQNGGDDIYDGFVNFGSATNIQIIQNGAVLSDDWWNSNGGLNPDPTQNISHRFMLKVRSGGVDIDGRRLIGTSRPLGSSYVEFGINGTARGNNVLALSPSTDLNNQTLEATIATWTDIVNITEGYNGLDADNNGTDEFYYSQWDLGSRSQNDFYERAKWLTREGSAETLYGLPGELFRGITHEIDIDGPSGTFASPEAVSWAGGTGQLLAIDDPTAGTKIWIQLLTGVAPTDNQLITGGTSAATALVNVNVIQRAPSAVFVGQSTGTSIIGAYGLGIDVADLTSNDQLFDLTNTSVSPPNFQSGGVGGLVVTEDRVLVAPWDGATLDPEGNPEIDYDQFTNVGGLTSATTTTVQVSAAIPADTPSSGTIRVQVDDGRYLRVPYDSWTGDTFTIPSFDFSGANAAAAALNVFISYIDTIAGATIENYTAVYSGDRNLVILVRDGGASPIKQFITAAVFGSGGFSVTAIRTSDA